MKATTTLATSQTPDGSKLSLQEHDGQFYLRVGGITLMSTIASGSEEKMAELACNALIDNHPRVLIGGLGFGYTLRRVLELMPEKATVVVTELLEDIVDWNREYLADVNGTCLDDPRAKIKVQDLHDGIKDGRSQPYDAILIDVDNSPDPLVQRNNARLYSRNGIDRLWSALKPGGRAVFWSAHRDRDFERALDAVFEHVDSIAAKAYPKAKKATHTLFVAQK